MFSVKSVNVITLSLNFVSIHQQLSFHQCPLHRQVSQLPHFPLMSFASPSTQLRFASSHEHNQGLPCCVSLHFDLVGRLLLEFLTASIAPFLKYALLVSELPTLMAVFSDDAFSVSFVGFLFLFPTLVQMVVLLGSVLGLYMCQPRCRNLARAQGFSQHSLRRWVLVSISFSDLHHRLHTCASICLLGVSVWVSKVFGQFRVNILKPENIHPSP